MNKHEEFLTMRSIIIFVVLLILSTKLPLSPLINLPAYLLENQLGGIWFGLGASLFGILVAAGGFALLFTGFLTLIGIYLIVAGIAISIGSLAIMPLLPLVGPIVNAVLYDKLLKYTGN